MGDPGDSCSSLYQGCPDVDRPDAAIRAFELPWASVRGATIRGVLHYAQGGPGQDSFSIGLGQAKDSVLVVVCDGVGSCADSHEGSSLAAHVALTTLKSGADPSESILAANVALSAFAEREPAKAFATTIVAAEIRFRSEECGGLIGRIAWLGDSSAWTLHGGVWAQLAGDGDPVSKTGSSVGIPQGSPVPKTQDVETFGPVFLFTDGISDCLYPGATTQRALAEWWEQPPDPYLFASQVALRNRGRLDDRTAVGVWPRSTTFTTASAAHLSDNRADELT